MEKTQKSKNPVANKLIYIVLTLILLSIMLLSVKRGNLSDSNLEDYETLETAIKSTSIPTHLPLNIKQYFAGEVEARDTLGQFIEVYKDGKDSSFPSAILKIGYFVDINADPLGLYSEPAESSEYTVSDNEYITYFRYRKGYPDYPNCTLINWSDEITSYGLMVEADLTESEVLKLLNLTSTQITKQLASVTSINNPSNLNIDWKEYKLASSLSGYPDLRITLPDTSNLHFSINIYDAVYSSTVFLDNKMIMIVVWDGENIEIPENFEADYTLEERHGDKTTYIRYRSDNPYEENSKQYEVYEEIKSNMGYILDSIVEV